MNELEKKWEDLTRKYYAGETTLEEEKALRQHWLKESPNSPEGQLATFFKDESKEESGIDWDQLSAQFAEEDSSFGLPCVLGTGRQAQVGTFPEGSDPRTTAVSMSVGMEEFPQGSDSRLPAIKRSKISTKPTKIRHLWRYAAAIAAVVSLAFFLPRLLDSDSTATADGFPLVEAVDWSRYELTDPTEAKRVLRQSLGHIAEPLNQVTRAGKSLQSIQLLNNPLTGRGR